MASIMLLILQVVVGLVVVFGVYRMSLWLLQQDRMVQSDLIKFDSKQRVRIVDGYALAGMATNRSWSTINPAAGAYMPLQRSYNRKGGAQFSYSFWLFLEDVTPANVGGRDILVRGDTRSFAYSRETKLGQSCDVGNKDVAAMTGMMIKCPRIRFGPTFDTIVAEFNTLHNPDERVTISPAEASGGDPSMRANILKLAQSKWALYTFTFEDNMAITDFEDGIIVRFYINDVQYHTARIKSTLRQNSGSVYLLPTREGEEGIKGARIGDVNYYNYALGSPQVREMYRAGPPRHIAKDIMGDRNSLGDPLHLSEYNRLDVYNT